MYSQITRKRFFSKFSKSNSCWVWHGLKNKAGYGRFGGKYAHRMSWEIFNNQIIPLGMLVCHHCDNPGCVNPDHLFLGTQKDNMQDMISKNRQAIQNNSGEKNPMFGKKHSNQAKAKQSDAKKGRYKGSKHPRASINEETANKIKEIRSNGVSAKQIAEQLMVSFHVVRNVIYGKSWK